VAGDVLGEVLDGNPRLEAPDVGLAEDELVEGDVARGAQGDFGNVLGQGDPPRRAAESLSLSTYDPSLTGGLSLTLIGGSDRDGEMCEARLGAGGRRDPGRGALGARAQQRDVVDPHRGD
jgi:hypothetical protein